MIMKLMTMYTQLRVVTELLVLSMIEWALFLFFIMIIRLEDKDLAVDFFQVGQRPVPYTLIDICNWGYILYWWSLLVLDFTGFLDE